MQPSTRINSLITRASMRAGNQSRLAKMLEVSPGNVTDWLEGRRPCPLEAQILMAPLADENVDSVIHTAIVEKHEGTSKGEKLISALGKGLMASGGLTVTMLSGRDASASSLNVAVDLLRCILC